MPPLSRAAFDDPRSLTVREHIVGRVGVLTLILAVMWFVRLLDTFTPDGISAAGYGIVPRSWDGLSGIASAPFIHSSWAHLIANTIPFAVLGSFILINGVGEFLFVFFVSGLVAGAGTWLFGAPNTQHVGASGVVLGFMGFLLFRSAFDRKITSAVITIGVAVLYASALATSLIPREDVSWTNHFFGVVGGIIAARLRYPASRRVTSASKLLQFRR